MGAGGVGGRVGGVAGEGGVQGGLPLWVAECVNGKGPGTQGPVFVWKCGAWADGSGLAARREFHPPPTANYFHIKCVIRLC